MAEDDEKSWREYRLLHIKTIDWLVSEVRRIHDEILVLKLKLGLIVLLASTISSIAVTVIIQLVLRNIK